MIARLSCRQLLRRTTEHSPVLALARRCLWIGEENLRCSPRERLAGATTLACLPWTHAGLQPTLLMDLLGQTRLKHGSKKGKGSRGDKGGRDRAEDDGEGTLDDIAGIPETKARYDRVLEEWVVGGLWMHRRPLAMGEIRLKGLKTEFQGLRGGKPDPGMLDHVEVDSYGSTSPLSSVAQASLKGPQLMVLTLYDPGLMKAVEEAVRECGMGLNPCVEGQGQVRVPLPKVTKESRDALAKVAAKHTEKAKVVMRGIRHKVLDQVKKKKDLFPEDEVHRRLKEIDTCTQEAEADASKLLERKKSEIMGV